MQINKLVSNIYKIIVNLLFIFQYFINRIMEENKFEINNDYKIRILIFYNKVI